MTKRPCLKTKNRITQRQALNFLTQNQTLKIPRLNPYFTFEFVCLLGQCLSVVQFWLLWFLLHRSEINLTLPPKRCNVRHALPHSAPTLLNKNRSDNVSSACFRHPGTQSFYIVLVTTPRLLSMKGRHSTNETLAQTLQYFCLLTEQGKRWVPVIPALEKEWLKFETTLNCLWSCKAARVRLSKSYVNAQ